MDNLRALDARIAGLLGIKVEQVEEDDDVFGGAVFTASREWLYPGDYYYHDPENYNMATEVPRYSTDGKAMLELDAEMRRRGWDLYIKRVKSICTARWDVEDGMPDYDMRREAPVMPLAVARAAEAALLAARGARE